MANTFSQGLVKPNEEAIEALVLDYTTKELAEYVSRRVEDEVDGVYHVIGEIYNVIHRYVEREDP